MNKFKKKLNKILNSKKTAIVLTVFLLVPFLLFGTILIRDYLQTGNPAVGSRNDGALEHTISKEQLKTIEEAIAEDMILDSKVVLKSSTLRVYAQVSGELSKKVMEEVGDRILASVNETLPTDPYFTTTENNKQYDLEIHVYNDVEDRESADFVYFQIIDSSIKEDLVRRFVTDPKDPDYKEDVLENEKIRLEKLEEKAKEESGEE